MNIAPPLIQDSHLGLLSQDGVQLYFRSLLCGHGVWICAVVWGMSWHLTSLDIFSERSGTEFYFCSKWVISTQYPSLRCILLHWRWLSNKTQEFLFDSYLKCNSIHQRLGFWVHITHLEPKKRSVVSPCTSCVGTQRDEHPRTIRMFRGISPWPWQAIPCCWSEPGHTVSCRMDSTSGHLSTSPRWDLESWPFSWKRGACCVLLLFLWQSGGF